MAWRPLIENLKSLNRSPTHFCFRTSGIFSTENDSGPTETEWLRKINKARINPSPLRPLRGAIFVEKGDRGDRGRDVLENAARVVKETRFATNSGMGSVTMVKTCKDCPFKHVRDPKPRSTTPKKKGRGKKGRSPSQNRKSKEEMTKIPCTYFQQGNCTRGTSAFTNTRKLLPPQRNPKGPIALH